MTLSLSIILKTLGDIAVYVPHYLSSPLSREWPIAGSTLAIVGMTTTLYYWVYYFRHPYRVSALQKLCLYLSTCIIVSAVFTAFGRVIYPNSATAERYQTLVLPWLPSMFGLVWSDIRHRKQHALYLAVWSAIFFCYLLPTQPVSAKNMVILSSRVHLAHTAARAGVLEPPYILATLSYPLIKNNINSVKDNDFFLRSHSLGYFQHLPQFSLGERLPITNASPCTGDVSSRLDTKAQAWIFDGQLLINTQQAATDIVITQNSIIKGLGILIGADDSLLPATRQDVQQTRFRAFAHQTALNQDTEIILWGIRKGVIQCQMPLPKLMP